MTDSSPLDVDLPGPAPAARPVAATPAPPGVGPPPAGMEAVFRPTRVLDIDLDQPPSDLGDLSGYAGVRALVWLHDVPVGTVGLPVHNGRCDGATLRRALLEQLSGPAVTHLLADRLATAASDGPPAALARVEHPPAASPLPSLTIAVCTRDRTASLRDCLTALVGLDYGGDLELLVVDNAPSDDATAQLVAGSFPGARYVREPRPGLDWARNRAVAEARGEVLAFTDDDVVVDRRWARALGAAFAEAADVMAVTGLVEPFELETPAQELFERYGGFGRGYTRAWFRLGPGDVDHIGAGRFGTGANMAFRRRVFDELGGFDPALDVGTLTNGGGDLEMFFRVLQEGHTLLYEPAAVVRHRHRRDLPALHAQITNNGVGFYAFLVRSALAYPQQRGAIVAFGLRWWWGWSVRRWLLSHVRPTRFPRDLIVAELRGSLRGLTRYPRARRVALRASTGRPVPVAR